MSDVNDPLAWIERAEEDYLLARSALRRKKPLTYGACFHAQQCAEKYLKAILVARGVAFAKVIGIKLRRGRLEIAPEEPPADRPPARTEASTQVDAWPQAPEVRLESLNLMRMGRGLCQST